MFKNIERKKLGDQVIHQLQEKISLGELKPGEKIPTETELMTLFGVGRSTVREAVRVLAKAGLLEVRQGDGTYVLDRTNNLEPLEHRLRRASILEVYEVRRALELEIAKLAARRRSEEDLLAMRESLAKRREARRVNDKRSYVDADLLFHLAIAAASKNSVLTDLYFSFSNTVRDALDKLISDQELHKNQISIHEQLLAAIERQDEQAAVYWAAQNLDRTMEDLQASLGATC
ncbi:DNA-binding FadR family transcriptional regulator [Anaerospora hongkongensis]|uniref:DNA-binding FadR family transcriptional regulator n=1 Tax=Anaerospora hongkongensis TaxID=244830 RepID=A0A4R1PXX4_9FIRM|nr:FadR/GntR family transcriptional regulator [Anaerospora hongkongensis]TCL37396.1 DNA-binding FadR family transcriptional regulator [Anaerospora hongkongensis]